MEMPWFFFLNNCAMRMTECAGQLWVWNTYRFARKYIVPCWDALFPAGGMNDVRSAIIERLSTSTIIIAMLYAVLHYIGSYHNEISLTVNKIIMIYCLEFDLCFIFASAVW